MDLPAVVAALTLPYSNGPIEGASTKVKLLKRQMYGRAGFALLRQRILLARPDHRFCAKAEHWTVPHLTQIAAARLIKAGERSWASAAEVFASILSAGVCHPAPMNCKR